jgi:hypothetical protein
MVKKYGKRGGDRDSALEQEPPIDPALEQEPPPPPPTPPPTQLELKNNAIQYLLSFIDTSNYQNADNIYDEVMASMRIALGLPETQEGFIVVISDEELANITLPQLIYAVNYVLPMLDAQAPLYPISTDDVGGQRKKSKRGGDKGPLNPLSVSQDFESDPAFPDPDESKNLAIQYLHDNVSGGNVMLCISLLRERLGLAPDNDVYPEELYNIQLPVVIQAVNDVLAQINPNAQPFVVGGRRRTKGSTKGRKSSRSTQGRYKSRRSKGSIKGRTKKCKRNRKGRKSKKARKSR